MVHLYIAIELYLLKQLVKSMHDLSQTCIQVPDDWIQETPIANGPVYFYTTCKTVEGIQLECRAMHYFGEKFFSKGITEVDDTILPDIISGTPDGISPRVFPGYAILF